MGPLSIQNFPAAFHICQYKSDRSDIILPDPSTNTLSSSHLTRGEAIRRVWVLLNWDHFIIMYRNYWTILNICNIFLISISVFNFNLQINTHPNIIPYHTIYLDTFNLVGRCCMAERMGKLSASPSLISPVNTRKNIYWNYNCCTLKFSPVYSLNIYFSHYLNLLLDLWRGGEGQFLSQPMWLLKNALNQLKRRCRAAWEVKLF